MAETIKVPYGDGIEDAVAVEVPEGAKVPAFEVGLPEGRRMKVQLQVVNIFQLLTRKDEKGDPIFLLSVQFKTETISKQEESPLLDEKR